jgi:hypothetical protein
MPRTHRIATLALTLATAALAALAGCDDGASKVKEMGKKIDKAVDKLDTDEASGHLAAAKQAVAHGREPAEACSWAQSATADNAAEAARATVAELRTLCTLEVPLGRATRALAQAEAARAELPDAPSLTECSSDDWARARGQLERDHGAEARWTALKARWAKACPGG